MSTDLLTMFVALVAIIGNSFVCHIILHSQFVKKTAFNYVLLNLAILDVITSILVVYKTLVHYGPLYHEDKGDGIMRVYNQSHVGAEIMCKINQSVWIGSRVTPAFLLVIAYERYKATVEPLNRIHGKLSARKLKLAIGFSWIWGIVPFVFFMASRKVASDGCQSIIAEWFNRSVYTIMSVALCFLLPCVVMSVLYYKVIITMRKHVQLGVQAAVQRTRETERRKVITMIITVTVLFYVFCGFPHVAYITSVVFTFHIWIDSVQILLYTINSVANPLVYFIFLKSFRMGLKSIFKCRIPDGALSFLRNHNSFPVHPACNDNVISKMDNNIKLLKINELLSAL